MSPERHDMDGDPEAPPHPTSDAQAVRGVADEGMSLQSVSRALAAAERLESVVVLVCETSLALGEADGVYVERVDWGSDEVEVVAASGWGAPAAGMRVPYPGSLTEAVLAQGEPEWVDDLVAAAERPIARVLRRTCRSCRGLVLPLISEGDALGALVLLRRSAGDPFDAAAAERVRVVADLGALALRRHIELEAAERRQEELETGRRRLRGVLDALPVGVFVADPSGRLLEVNEAARELWEGKTPLVEHPSEYGAYRAFLLGSDTPIEPHEWGIARVVETGEATLDQELEIETSGGIRRTILNHAVPVRDGDGRLIAAVAVNVDISEQRRARDVANFMSEASRELASSLDYRDTLREVARLAVPRIADWCAVYVAEDGEPLEPIEVAHVDPDRTEFARELLRRFPPDPDAPVGIYAAFRNGEPELLPRIDEEVLDALAQDDDHLALLREAGLTSAISVPMIARGRRVGAIGLATSSASRRFTADDLRLARQLADRAALAVDNARLFHQAARRAQEEEALRRATHAVTASYSVAEVTHEIAGNALDAVSADGAYVEQIDLPNDTLSVAAIAGTMTPDSGLRHRFAGSIAEEALRTHRPQVVDRLAEAAFPLPGDFKERCGACSAAVLPLINGGEAVGALTLIRGPDRPPFGDEDLARARTFADLAALAFRKLHLLEDSERRREALEAVLESRARLVRGLTHDLRNPLGSADGMASLLEQGILGELPERAADGVGRMRRALGRAIELMDDLIEFARAEAGELNTEEEAVDLRDVASEMLEEYRPRAESKGLDVRFMPPADLPPIVSDAGRVRQIVGNLLSNAVKYTPSGGRIEIRIEPRREDDGRGWIDLSVSDTGPGIDPRKQEEVFLEFTRLEPATAEGSGLGLAIGRRIARALGGELTLESTPGEGSVFTLSLPAE